MSPKKEMKIKIKQHRYKHPPSYPALKFKNFPPSVKSAT